MRKIHSHPGSRFASIKRLFLFFLSFFPRAIIRCLMIFAFSPAPLSRVFHDGKSSALLCSRATRKRVLEYVYIPDESARGASLPGVNDSLRLSLGSFVPLQRATCSVPSPTWFRADSSRRISVEDNASTFVNSREQLLDVLIRIDTLLRSYENGSLSTRVKNDRGQL